MYSEKYILFVLFVYAFYIYCWLKCIEPWKSAIHLNVLLIVVVVLVVLLVRFLI